MTALTLGNASRAWTNAQLYQRFYGGLIARQRGRGQFAASSAARRAVHDRPSALEMERFEVSKRPKVLPHNLFPAHLEPGALPLTRQSRNQGVGVCDGASILIPVVLLLIPVFWPLYVR